MPQARDEAGNIWEVDEQGRPVRLISRGNDQMVVPSDPRKAAAQGLDDAYKQGQIAAQGRGASLDANTLSNTKYDNVTTMRKDYNSLQVVKEYKAILPLLMSGLTTKPNPQGDASLIYAYAKVMDPGSVVRESEGQAAANTASFWDAKAEQIKKNMGFTDARGLPEGAARGLRVEMNNKVAQMSKAYDLQRQYYQKIAQENGFDPYQVVGPQDSEPFRKQYESAIKDLYGRSKQAGGEIATSGKYSRPEDVQFANMLNSAYKGGASYDVLNQMSQSAGRGSLDSNPDFRRAVEARDAGRPNDYIITPGENGDLSKLQSALGEFANSPAGTFTASALNAGGLGIPQLAAGDAPFDAMRNQNWKSALGGDVVGGLVGTAGLAKGLNIAGLSGLKSLPAANVGYGTIFGANTNEDNRLAGAGIGAGASLAGEGIGRFVVAPTARAVADIAPVRKGINRLGGMFGNRSVVPQKMLPGEKDVATQVSPELSDVVSRLNEATGMGLPMSPADVSPQLRMTLGSASRLNPDVRAAGERILGERAVTQGDRAVRAVNDYLAPAVNMQEAGNAIRNSARRAAQPYYDTAMAAPTPDSTQLDAFLNTPAGRQAARNAYDIGLNNGISPADISISALPDGTASLNANPNWSSLDLVKKGLDAKLNEFRNPITGRLNTEGNPVAQSVEGLRQRYVGALDQLNPDYAKARAVYAENIAPREAMGRGYDAASPSMTTDSMNAAIQSLKPNQIDPFRSGYATSLVDQIEKQRFSANPYDLVGSGIGRVDKMQSLFPMADKFLRQRQLENEMALTAKEVLGGSPTAGRSAADSRFQIGIPDIAEIGVSAATGMPPANVAAKAGLGMFGKRAQRTAEKRAGQVGPILMNTDPQSAISELIRLGKMKEAVDEYVRRTNAGIGLLGGIASGSVAQGY